MKVKQIVSEHKKGVRAHIYNKKATTKAQGPVPLYGPGKQDAKLKPVKINEAPEDAAIHAQVAALSATNPQFAAEVRKVPPIMRGMSGDSAKHNAMVLQQLKSLLQKYSGNAVQEEMPGQMVGKVQQVNPDGTAVIQSPDGKTQTVQQTQLQQGDNNTLSMQVPKIQPGQQVDASKTIEEDPGVPYYVDMSSGKPMAKTGGRGLTQIVPSKMWTALTPEIEAKASSQGFRKVMLQFNNQKFAGLEGGDQKLGSKIIVAPADFQSMSTPAAPTMKESNDDKLLDKMLTIAGLR
jgi:hypothetical protein